MSVRVLFPNVQEPVGGKSYFLHLLYKELSHLKAKIVFEGPHDILFGSIRFHVKSNAKKILRLDGVIHNTRKPWKAKNASMRKQVDMADIVVCQSVFGFEMVSRYITNGNTDKLVVIGNGADLDATYIIPEEYREYRHNFLAVSKWRPHKRLKDTILSFVHADIPEACLWVVGKINDKTVNFKNYFKKYKNVRYLGHIEDRPRLFGLMKLATASIHLCWFDCYPNSVVEAVAMGCPVICNNVGGTQEIVRRAKGGMVLPLDKEYDYKPVDLYNPPPVDYDMIAKTLYKFTEEPRPWVHNKHIDIKRIARYYRRAIEVIENK